MSWATMYIEKLARGERVQFRPRGHSMEPRIKSGAHCVVAPFPLEKIVVGDVVLCTVGRVQYLHLVKAIEPGDPPKFTIGNNKGSINGKTSKVHGKLVAVVQ